MGEIRENTVLESTMADFVAGGQTFPSECPKDCPGRSYWPGQGGLCHRCPVFNCRDVDGEGFRLLDPEEYRPDWAKIWRAWFGGGMQGWPELPLTMKEE